MVYLIGGPPRVGKSTLARMLAREKAIPWISTDDIASVITPYIPESEYHTKLPIRSVRRETNYSNDVLFTRYAPEQIVGLYLRQAETLWRGFKNFIEYALADNHDFIVEGWQILPHLVQTVAIPERDAKIKVCFLYRQDVAEILMSLKSSTAKNDWVTNNTKQEATFLKIAKMISHFGLWFKDEAIKFNVKAVDMDRDFNQKIKALSEGL
jgi:2-phosphoglycerate kinase